MIAVNWSINIKSVLRLRVNAVDGVWSVPKIMVLGNTKYTLKQTSCNRSV